MTTDLDFHRLMKAITQATEDIKNDEGMEEFDYVQLVKYAWALGRLSDAVRDLAGEREKYGEAKSRRNHPTSRRGMF